MHMQTCPRPEVVEVWDVTSPDPRLLVWLKVSTHTVCLPPDPMQAMKDLNLSGCIRAYCLLSLGTMSLLGCGAILICSIANMLSTCLGADCWLYDGSDGGPGNVCRTWGVT